jgi:cardiolipin synthase
MEWPSNVLYEIISAGHVVLAVGVTIHALLTKRDVRGAIGWIGVVWLSPFLGPILYYVFGINRVNRKMTRISRDVVPNAIPEPMPEPASLSELPPNIAAINSVATRVTGRPLTGGNRVQVLRGGDEAYPAMLKAIEEAQTSIALSSYIFRRDHVGNAFVDALARARARRVEIRVLVDGIGSGYFFSPIVRRLRKSGIRAARFMHNFRPWRMSFINLRNHKKLLVIDGTYAFTGGLNLGDENVRRFRRSRPVDDVHFRVDGPVVGQIMLTFAEDWRFTTNELLTGAAWWPEIEVCDGCLARAASSGPDEDLGKIEAIWAAAINQAKERLRIVTPYFLPDNHLMASLILAALRGVKVELIIPERTDSRWLDWAMRAHLGFYPVPELECYLTPAPFDHAKLVTVDGRWCSVGSANWDVRSLRLNFEVLLESYDGATVRSIDELIDERLARAQRMALPDLDQRPILSRLRDGAARLLLPYL